MNPNERKKWIDLYKRTGNAGLTCQRCGISRFPEKEFKWIPAKLDRACINIQP